MKNMDGFKTAELSRAKMWRNILLILGSVALISSYIADIRDPSPGTETKENRLFVEQAHKNGFQTLHVRVARVVGGDTVYIENKEGSKVRVHLLGIDAPEMKQLYGFESAQHLRHLLQEAGDKVQFIYRDQDQYGRLLGKLIVEGTDLNLEQVKAGHAWVYRSFLQNLMPGDKNLYLNAEEIARNNRLGLWKDPNPQNPREWRREHPRN